MDNVDNKSSRKKRGGNPDLATRQPASRKTKLASPTPRRGAAEVSGLVVVANNACQVTEEIHRPDDHCAPSPSPTDGIKLRANAKKQPVDDILRVAPSLKRTRKQRQPTGLRIRKNNSGQGTQKIKRRPILVEPDEEIGYKKLFMKFEEAFVGRDLNALGKCLLPSFEWRLPNGDVVYGKEEALAEMERRFAMPNGPKFSKSVLRFMGETVIQTYRVEYMGPDGKWRKSRGMDLYKIRKGLIARKDAFWKMIP